MNSKNRRGFTLVELMVVISIIAILSTVGLAIFSGVQQSARNTKRKADLNSIAVAIEIHYVDPLSRCTVLSQKNPTAHGEYCPTIPGWFSSRSIPSDPMLAQPSSRDSGYCIAAYNTYNSGVLQLQPTSGNSSPQFDDMSPNPNAMNSGSGDLRCQPVGGVGYHSLYTDNLSSSIPGRPYQGTSYWKLCANLEPWGSDVYCVQSKTGS